MLVVTRSRSPCVLDGQMKAQRTEGLAASHQEDVVAVGWDPCVQPWSPKCHCLQPPPLSQYLVSCPDGHAGGEGSVETGWADPKLTWPDALGGHRLQAGTAGLGAILKLLQMTA